MTKDEIRKALLDGKQITSETHVVSGQDVIYVDCITQDCDECHAEYDDFDEWWYSGVWSGQEWKIV